MGDISTMLGLSSGGSSIVQSAIDVKRSRDQMRLSRQALDEQRAAQQQAQSASVAQQRRNEEARARAMRKSPNIAAILLGEQEMAQSQPGTSLSGPRGTSLSRSTLLGE